MKMEKEKNGMSTFTISPISVGIEHIYDFQQLLKNN